MTELNFGLVNRTITALDDALTSSDCLGGAEAGGNFNYPEYIDGVIAGAKLATRAAVIDKDLGLERVFDEFATDEFAIVEGEGSWFKRPVFVLGALAGSLAIQKLVRSGNV